MRPRLADIAARAGVSEATVSRVLNARPGVSPATRAAVITALDVAGYERPVRLRARHGGLVGLLLPELINPVFPAFAQAATAALAARSYTAVLCTQSPDGIGEDAYLQTMLDVGVSGIVVVSGGHADATVAPVRYRALVERGLPLALVNGYAAGVAAPVFSTDDREAVRLALAHLRALGHQRIGLAVGPERFVPVRRKAAAFVAGLAAMAGDGAAAGWVEHSMFTLEGGHAAGDLLLDRGATAVVCGSDLMALGVVRAARSRGLRVPRDVSVVGFDDSVLVAYTDPPLTTLRQPVAEMARAAVDAVLEAVAGRPVPAREYLFGPELVVRSSTAAAPPALLR